MDRGGVPAGPQRRRNVHGPDAVSAGRGARRRRGDSAGDGPGDIFGRHRPRRDFARLVSVEQRHVRDNFPGRCHHRRHSRRSLRHGPVFDLHGRFAVRRPAEGIAVAGAAFAEAELRRRTGSGQAEEAADGSGSALQRRDLRPAGVYRPCRSASDRGRVPSVCGEPMRTNATD